MKRSFLLLCAVLLVLGCALPCAAYRLARMTLAQSTAPSAAEASSAASEEGSGQATSPADTADTVCFTDQSTGQAVELPLREYLIGAVAAEMPVSWPDEALKAQAVAAHSYTLYRRDHNTGENGAWFTADPARRQGCLTDAVLHSYWGTAYAANYARLSALVDAVQTQVLYYGDAPAGTSYFAMSNGRTEASENVWGTALPYLVPVDSSTDTAADNYEYTLNLSAAQLQQLLAERLGIAANLSQQAQWFGTPMLTPSGYVDSLPVCGQTVQGTALRKALGLRSTCFTVVWQSGTFSFTTRGYGHGVGMSQCGAKALAEQGADYRAILAHYYPGTELRGGIATEQSGKFILNKVLNYAITQMEPLHIALCSGSKFISFYQPNSCANQLTVVSAAVSTVVSTCWTVCCSLVPSASLSDQ